MVVGAARRPLVTRGLIALRRPVARQFARFFVAGVSNTLTTFAAIYLIRHLTDASVGVASAIGYVVGVVQGFALSRFWTFAGVDHAAPVALQVAGFVVVNLIGGGIFTGTNVALSRILPLAAATVLAAAAVMPVTFALNRWGVFRERRR